MFNLLHHPTRSGEPIAPKDFPLWRRENIISYEQVASNILCDSDAWSDFKDPWVDPLYLGKILTRKEFGGAVRVPD